MRTSWKTLSVLATLLLAVGCGGDDTASDDTAGGDETAGGEHGEHGHGHHHGGEHHPEHAHQMSEAQTTFHDVFAPIWHAEPSDERTAQACGQLDELARLAAAAAESTTEGVEAPEAADAQIPADMAAAFDTLRSEGCAGEAPDADAVHANLSAIHDVFHRSMERWQALHAE